MEEIYIVRKEWIDDCETTRTEMVAHITEEGARKDFENVKNEIKNFWQDNFEEYVTEEDDNYFCIYIEGFYEGNHEFVVIEKIELQK